MHPRRFSLRAPSRLLIAAVLVSTAAAQTVKRPITHKDYDGWRSIVGQRLSPDGKWLAYGLFPQEGDGEVVVRNLATGQETRHAAGARPAPPPRIVDEPASEPRGVTIAFSSDSRTLVFSTFPPKAETDKAKKDKKPAERMPKDGMVIVDLVPGKATRIDRVKRFQMPEKAAGYLAYLREAPETGPEAAPAAQKKEGDDDLDQPAAARGATAPDSRARSEFGTDLVVRKLADSSERTFPDVIEFSLSDDAAHLVYAVSGKEASKNGVFVVKPDTGGAPAALLEGKGKYAKLTWDEKQSQLAFLGNRDDASSKQPKWKLYRWDLRPGAAAELASVDTPGFRKEFVISDKGNLSFSKDGTRLFFGCAPPAADKKDGDASADDKAVVDLWHYKDDYIQPMQKVRAKRDRERTYTAVYLIPENKLVQLGDPALAEITPSESPRWALGLDDRAYRRMTEYDTRYVDAYVVDVSTGGRTLVSRKNGSTGTWSPAGRYLLYFDGKDWNTISVPDGKTTNLTASLPVKFWNEESDTPGTPGAYGSAGWSKDGRWALLYDNYDIWRVSPGGSGAMNLTAGVGRKRGLRLRCVRLETDPRERWIDPAKALLLRAENRTTKDTGFFRAGFDGSEPEQLVMAAKNFAPPVKAKNADVYLLTRQTFSEFPDLFTTDAGFKEFRKVTDANPQRAQLLWGTAELVRFHNSDGVPLSGALFKPENFDPKKKYPMLVYIYERLSDQLNRFVDPRPGTSINISYYVSNGYLVFTPDIAYTVGFPGQSALKCVLPAVQAVVDRGFVDENAIGIQGHSWGGYQIAYMVTRTRRFRAVAAGAPVSDMVSAYDGIRWGSGIPRQHQYERTQSRIGGSIWEYPTRFIENSPIFWADRVQTPVLMLHNDGDDAVPWYQGVEFYLALRRLGKEVYLFVYNGELHGLVKRPNQKDYTIRMQQYFDHYLKGAPAPEWMEKGVPYLERDRTALSVLP